MRFLNDIILSKSKENDAALVVPRVEMRLDNFLGSEGSYEIMLHTNFFKTQISISN